MSKHGSLFAAFLVVAGAWVAPACGGDSEADGDGGSSGTGGATGGAGGTGATGGGGTGATGGGGTGATGGGGTGGKDSSACVASACPGFGQFASGCCLPDDTCGYDGSAFGYGCLSQKDVEDLLDGGLDVQTPPDASDPNCDDMTVGGYTLEGCCLPTGFCGLYDPILTKSCVDPSQFIDAGTPKPCGGDAAVPDAQADVSVPDAGGD